MALTNGTKLGPYEILSPLGAGGMGEVYRAKDTRLARTVAIKILPELVSGDAARRQRFEHEAKVISSLNHPHICTLYDVGQQDAVDFIVMEYLAGESLAERLEKGPLPVTEVLEYGIQIASALDKAHRHGVTHRDLKPGNIMLTKSGAKLLDFGLAKAAPALATGVTLTEITPQATPPMTQVGAVVGTVPYMSPEQVEGKEADARSDIFSLGAVLYEMVTGSRAFQGKSQLSVASAILYRDPKPLSKLQPLTPQALNRAIGICLAKDPIERWQSADDLWGELRRIAEGRSKARAPIAASVLRILRAQIAWILAAIFAMVAVVALLLASRYRRGPEPLAFRQLNFRREAVFQAAFAAERDTFLYSAATSGNTPQIFMVRPDYPEPQPLGPPGMALLAVSSKDELAVLVGARFVSYRLFTGTLARMPMGGGAPREIQEGVRQADWSPDGSQLAIIRDVGGRDRLEYPIGHVLREVSGYMTDLRVSPSVYGRDRTETWQRDPTQLNSRRGECSMTSTRIRVALGLALGFMFASFSALPLFANSANGRLVDRELQSKNFEGNKVGTSPVRKMVVYLPAGYDDSSKHYPVIYFLPSPFENYRLAFDQRDAQGLLDRATSTGMIDKFILVCVDMTTPLGSSWYVNSPVTGNWENFMIREMVPYIDASFRTLPHRDSRGIAGDFMGGYGAIRFGMKHPDVFGSVYALHPVGTGSGVQVMYARPNWDVLANATSLNDVKKDGLSQIFTTIFQAHLPNPDKPPLFIDLQAHKVGNQLVIDSKVTERLRDNFFLESMIPQYADNLKSLRGFKFDWARSDTNFDHVYSNQAFTHKLNEFGIAHEAEEYNGAWGEGIWSKDGRIYTEVLPFFERHLVFESNDNDRK